MASSASEVPTDDLPGLVDLLNNGAWFEGSSGSFRELWKGKCTSTYSTLNFLSGFPLTHFPFVCFFPLYCQEGPPSEGQFDPV